MAQIFTVENGSESPNDVFSTNITRTDTKNRNKRACTRIMTIVFLVAAIVFFCSTVVLALVIWQKYGDEHQSDNTVPNGSSDTLSRMIQWPKASGSLYGQFKRAAIATDHGLCSEIGRDILFLGGNAIDATVAALICVGVVNPQSSGLGGGFIMTIYNSTTGRCITVNAREAAPASANSTMFVKNATEAKIGYRSIAVPSELHGFWTVFQKFGSHKVSWQRLFQPSIDLAMNGFPVSSHLAMILAKFEEEIIAEPTLKRIFVDALTGRVYEEGDRMKREHLGQTLQLIANATDPVRLFYQEGLAQTISSEILENGGHVTLDDLKNYATLIDDSPIESENLPGDLAMCGPPPPSSYAVTQSIIAIMAEFYGGKGQVDLDDPLVYHRLIETEKFAYAQRAKLGDIAFVKSAEKTARNMTTKSYAKWISSMIKDKAQPLNFYSFDRMAQVPDHGTSHTTAIDEQENAVSCTSTVNQWLGSMRASKTLGVIWNDEMDDFSTPGVPNAFGFAPSEANYIAPGKRPMTSMSPMIIYNKNTGKVKLVIGASGGSRIVSAVAQAAIRLLLFNQTIKEAVDAPRLHNQFLPHVTEYENTFPAPLIETLIAKYGQNMTGESVQRSVVQALEVKEDGFIHGNSDFRRKTAAHPAGF